MTYPVVGQEVIDQLDLGRRIIIDWPVVVMVMTVCTTIVVLTALWSHRHKIKRLILSFGFIRLDISTEDNEDAPTSGSGS